MVLHKSYPDENEMQQPEQTISQNNENHRLCRGSICPYTLRMALVGGWFQVDIGSPGTQVHIPWQERHPVLKKARYVQRALPPPSGLWVPFSHDLASARIRHGPSQ